VPGFHRKDGHLWADGVDLARLVREAGTPVYVYSADLIAENYRRFDTAFSPVDHLVCYAAKANSNLAVLRLLAGLGAGADVVSGGELRAAMECGIPPSKIVFSGVGKTDEELAAGVAAGILTFNVESERELVRLDAAARARGVVARAALRVNPDIDAKTHPHISTGLAHNKFGVDIGRAPQVYAGARSLENVRMTGVQAHIGSQIRDPEPLAETARELADLARRLRAEGSPLETIDVGGGVGIAGEGEGALSPEAYAAAVLPPVSPLGMKVLTEPGRAIVGTAGVLLTRVLDVKENGSRTFIVADAGMNDLIRPALYGAVHEIEPVGPPRGGPIVADVVGPVCESSDFFLRDGRIGKVQVGDLLAIRDTGAYGFAMASNYNFRGRPPEVLVEGDAHRIVRRRETWEDLTAPERT
jgi:diaminopimelate decarboxylase